MKRRWVLPLFAIVFFLCVCVPDAAVAQDTPQAAELTERMVEVDGHAMRVATAGLDARRPGMPVVVFENGATAPLDAWAEVPARVAAFAPVVAYDRATVGRSAWDGEIGTPSHVTARLWALLDTLGVDPPYVLVGWSWGGDLVRHHAGSHPKDVAGLVHVDPAAHSASAALAVLRAIGLGEEVYVADIAAMEDALPSIPPSLQADVKPINQIYADRAEPEYGAVPPVPTAVLISGMRRPPSQEELEAFGQPPYDRQVHFEAKLRDKISRVSEWVLSSPDGLLLLVRSSGHAMQEDVPELVVEAIRRVVFPDGATDAVGGLSPASATDQADSAIVLGVADEYFEAYAARAVDLDHPGASHDRLPDNSLADLRRWQEREDGWLTRLDAVDADALWGSTAWALYASLRERLEASVQFRVCRRPLWNVDPDWGWHIDSELPELARSQPVGTSAARAAALQRWSGFGRFIDTEIENLRQGVREGYVAPRVLVEEVIEQVGRLAGQAPEESTFYHPARRDTTPEFREAFGRIVADEILPALRRFESFLTREYLPRARSEAALTSMPNGLECYRAFLRMTTGLPLDETQVDSIGRALLERALAERDRVARTRYGLSDGRALSEAMAADSALMWTSHAEALAAARSAVTRAADLLPRYFSRLPPIPPLVVDTMSTEDALNAWYGAYYAGIPTDAAQPARLMVNPMMFDDPGSRGRLGPLMYHEGLPGHHLQSAVDRAFGSPHPYARYADDEAMAGVAGFTEGWATYAQHFLALEMGLLSDAEDLVRSDYEIAELMWFLVTDGVHMRGWSEEQVRDTVRQYLAGLDDDVLHDTYIVAVATPGYTLTYLLGALEIQRLRMSAERELGPLFDLREFHDQVLRHGDIPLRALSEAVERWIRDKGS